MRKGNWMRILGGPDAWNYLRRLHRLGYQAPKSEGNEGGYYKGIEGGYFEDFQKNQQWKNVISERRQWIGYWIDPTGEVFVEDFDNKADSIWYAQGVQVKLYNGTWK